MDFFPSRDNILNQNMMEQNRVTSNIQAQIDVITTTVFNYLVWGDSTADTILVKDTGYIANNIARINYTLPATADVGDRYGITGKGAGGWKVVQGALQRIHFGTLQSVSGAAGYLQSGHFSDTVHIICITANTDFRVVWANGDIDINI